MQHTMSTKLKRNSDDPELGEIHANAACQLDHQNFAIVNGLTLTAERFAALSYLFGEVVPPGLGDNLVTNIDTSETSGELEVKLHTDKCYWRTPPKYLLLYVSKASGMIGGDMIVSDLFSSLSALSIEEQKLISRFKVTIKSPSNRVSSITTAHLVNYLNNQLSFVRFRTDLILSEKELISKWYRKSEEISVSLTLRSGDLLVIDNWRVAHGRMKTSFDGFGSRCALRTLVI